MTSSGGFCPMTTRATLGARPMVTPGTGWDTGQMTPGAGPADPPGGRRGSAPSPAPLASHSGVSGDDPSPCLCPPRGPGCTERGPASLMRDWAWCPDTGRGSGGGSADRGASILCSDQIHTCSCDEHRVRHMSFLQSFVFIRCVHLKMIFN